MASRTISSDAVAAAAIGILGIGISGVLIIVGHRFCVELGLILLGWFVPVGVCLGLVGLLLGARSLLRNP